MGEGDGERRERVRVALEAHGVASSQAGALAKSLLDLVTVIGVEGCRAAFQTALGEAPARTSPGPAAGEVAEMERMLGSFVGELRRLDETLQVLTRQLERAAPPKSPPEPGTLH
jgi:hypothetical protein